MSEGLRPIIVGGYGEGGQHLARCLAQIGATGITLAGRSPGKARVVADKLGSETGATFSVLEVDLGQPEQVERCVEGHNMVLIACELPFVAIAPLILSCVNAEADYVDIVPQSGKASVFSSYQGTIAAGTSRFVLEAGADPGLPNWLARMAVQGMDSVERLLLFGRYRSSDIGWDGAGDILRSAGAQGWIYSGQWCRARPWDLRLPRFEAGLGRSLAVPIYLDDLSPLPEELGVRELRCYHAGLNPVTDALMLLESLGVLSWCSFTTRQRLFHWALKRFTRAPSGLSLSAEVCRDGRCERVSLCHSDLYEATAIPAVTIARFLHEDDSLAAGYDYFGDWASRFPGFAGVLEEGGFRINRSSDNVA